MTPVELYWPLFTTMVVHKSEHRTMGIAIAAEEKRKRKSNAKNTYHRGAQRARITDTSGTFNLGPRTSGQRASGIGFVCGCLGSIKRHTHVDNETLALSQHR